MVAIITFKCARTLCFCFPIKEYSLEMPQLRYQGSKSIV